MKKYYKRVVDKELDLKLEAFGAVHIVGPKWCGKTTTAQAHSKSAIKFQKDPNKEGLIETAKINPSILLRGEKPRLIDEWQDAPNIWDAVRVYCDENEGKGHFILTGSTAKKVEVSHTGTGRISKLKMYPMSLYESEESNGSVSLIELFNGRSFEGCVSDLEIEDLIFAACRGGWPACLDIEDKRAQLLVAKDYFRQIYSADIYEVDKVKRSEKTMESVLRSYARNISTLAKKKSLLEDVNGIATISDKTLDDYIDVLERLYIVEDLEGWTPSFRSSRGMRSGKKREFTDPSIAVAALGASPDTLNIDLKTFGFIFECLCIRDLRIYSSSMGGRLSYYRDQSGLEADAILHLEDGRYALVEFKLGSNEIDKGAKNLLKLEELIKAQNEGSSQLKYRLPDLKLIISGGKYGYKREDGVYVIPIGSLRP